MIYNKISLLLCLFLSNTFAAQWGYYHFKLEHRINFLLLPEFNLARYYGESIIHGYFINNTHSILKAGEFELGFRGQDTKDIKLSKCKLFSDSVEDIQKPFMMVINDGILKEIKVTKDEVQEVVNLKFILASHLQHHWSKLTEQDEPQFTTKTKELTAHGVCEVDYHVEQSVPNPNKIYYLQKNFSDSCISSNDPTESYLLPECSKLPHKQKRSTGGTDAVLQLISPITYNISIDSDFMSYRPFEASTDRLFATSLYNVTLLSLEFVDEISDIGSNLEVSVTEITKVKVNETLFYDDTTAKNAKLRYMYKGLSCGSEMNIYSTLVGQALVCDA